MKIDTKALQIELNGLANPIAIDKDGNKVDLRRTGLPRIKVAVKTDRAMAAKLGVTEYERAGIYGFIIRLNPLKIRRQGDLDSCLGEARKAVQGL